MFLIISLQDQYDSVYLQKVTHCPILTVDQILRGQSQGAKEVQVQYDRSQQFTSMARQFKVMDDLKVHVYAHTKQYSELQHSKATCTWLFAKKK